MFYCSARIHRKIFKNMLHWTDATKPSIQIKYCCLSQAGQSMLHASILDYKVLTISKLAETKIAVHLGFVKLCRTVTKDGNISNQVIEIKMTEYIGFVKFCTAVNTDDDISNQPRKEKMIVHIGFVELCMAVTADGNTSNQVTEAKMTMHL